jgi:peptidoglycan-associated lipoprotein
MNRFLTIGPVALIGASLMTGCATRGQLRTGLEEQRTALTAEIAAERDARTAADQQMQQNIASLQSDLQGLRTEFGAKITALEEGMRFAMPIQFGFDQADVSNDGYPALDRFASVVQQHYGNSLITVEGFADPAGPARYNERLSLRRAQAVRDYLISKGLPAEQLRAVGYGETRLVAPGAAADESGADRNRRVAFVVEGDLSGAMGVPSAPAAPMPSSSSMPSSSPTPPTPPTTPSTPAPPETPAPTTPETPAPPVNPTPPTTPSTPENLTAPQQQ